MEIRIETRVLNRLVARCAPATSSKSPMSMLKHLLFTAEQDGSLKCVGTDLILSVTASAQCEVAKPGAFAVLAREFSEIVRRLPGSEVLLAIKDGKLEVRSGKSRFKLPCADADDYPNIPAPVPEAPGNARLRIASLELSRLLQQTSYARAADDDSRAFIACVRLEHAGGVATCVATDSARMGLATAKVDGPDWGHDHIHSRAIADVRRLCEEFGEESVAISSHGGLEGWLFFEWSSVTLTARNAGTNFVPYQKFVPTTFERVAEVGRQELIDAIRRVALASDSKIGAVECVLSSEGLTVKADSSDKGSAVDEISVDYAAEEFRFGVRAGLMVEALSSITDDRVLLKTNGERDPIVVTGSSNEAECLALVMQFDLEKVK